MGLNFGVYISFSPLSFMFYVFFFVHFNLIPYICSVSMRLSFGMSFASFVLWITARTYITCIRA